MFGTLLTVALGGAIGATLRYLVGIGVVRMLGHGFPLGIITVNVVGSFLMGVFVVAAAHRGLTHLSPVVMTGFLGGFTTFSAFSLDFALLLERGDHGLAAVYLIASVAASIVALFAGLGIARMALA